MTLIYIASTTSYASLRYNNNTNTATAIDSYLLTPFNTIL